VDLSPWSCWRGHQRRHTLEGGKAIFTTPVAGTHRQHSLYPSPNLLLRMANCPSRPLARTLGPTHPRSTDVHAETCPTSAFKEIELKFNPITECLPRLFATITKICTDSRSTCPHEQASTHSGGYYRSVLPPNGYRSPGLPRPSTSSRYSLAKSLHFLQL